MSILRCPPAMSPLTAAEKSDKIGYIRRVSPTRTTTMPLACSVFRFMLVCPAAPRVRSCEPAEASAAGRRTLRLPSRADLGVPRAELDVGPAITA